VIVNGERPASMESWVGCVAGALEEREFLRLLGEVGFVDASIEPTRVYDFEGINAMSAFVRARKPA
jgi:hypothetical protein